jgi:hypothetical protein
MLLVWILPEPEGIEATILHRAQVDLFKRTATPKTMLLDAI